MKNSILFILLLVFVTVSTSGCAFNSAQPPKPIPATSLPIPESTTTATSLPMPDSTTTATSTLPPAWEVYTNEKWGFLLEHPTVWVISDTDSASGFIGQQVFWWVGNYDPMKQKGDMPGVGEIAEANIDGQQAKRILGHYLGAMGGMGEQQYLRYIVQKGDLFYMFCLYAVDARGMPSDRMNEKLPLRESDIALFEQMIATLKFKD